MLLTTEILMSEYFFSCHLVFVDTLESLVGFLPGMWQQSIPDILWSDKVLGLFCCLQ